MNALFNYPDYISVPEIIKDYIKTVADVKVIEAVTLEDINEFLKMLYETIEVTENETGLQLPY